MSASASPWWVKPLVLLLALAPASTALAGQLKLLQEFPDGTHKLVEKVSAQRFVKLGVEWERRTDGRANVPRFELFDFAERKIVQLPIPLDELPKSHLDVLGPHPAPTLIHHDGAVSSMLFSEFKSSQTVGKYLCQYDHRTRRFSELVSLGRWDASRYAYELGVDPKDEFFIFAFAVNDGGNALKDGFTSFELFRLDLKTRAIEAITTLAFPKRSQPLKLCQRFFSHDGTKLVLVEYSDVGIQRDHPPAPLQQAYVIDLQTKKIDTYPVPISTYGGAFSRDGKYLLFGSNELGQVLRIDLAAKKIDRTVQAAKLIHHFFPTPGGKSFLVVGDTMNNPNKAVEVRRVDDLSLVTSIPVRLLYPGNDGVRGSGVASENGRFLILPMVDRDGWPAGKGFRIFEVPDEVDSPRLAGTSEETVRTAQGIALGKRYAETHGILIRDVRVEDPSKTFAPVVVTTSGDVLLLGTRTENTDGDYQVGRTRPVLVRLNPQGKLHWERVLTRPGFLDYEGGSLAATADGGCVVHVISYVHPARNPVARLVKLDASGKTLWDTRFKGDGGKDSPLADRCELSPSGAVTLTGRITLAAEEQQRQWKAVVDANGKVLSDDVAP